MRTPHLISFCITGLSTLNFRYYYSHYYFKNSEYLEAWQVFPAARDMPSLYWFILSWFTIHKCMSPDRFHPGISIHNCWFLFYPPKYLIVYLIRSSLPLHVQYFLKARQNKWKEQNASSEKHCGYLFFQFLRFDISLYSSVTMLPLCGFRGDAFFDRFERRYGLR